MGPRDWKRWLGRDHRRASSAAAAASVGYHAAPWSRARRLIALTADLRP